jgi:hypothetical protein
MKDEILIEFMKQGHKMSYEEKRNFMHENIVKIRQLTLRKFLFYLYDLEVAPQSRNIYPVFKNEAGEFDYTYHPVNRRTQFDYDLAIKIVFLFMQELEDAPQELAKLELARLKGKKQ